MMPCPGWVGVQAVSDMGMRAMTIIDTKMETLRIRSLRFKEERPASAGHFVVVSMRGVDEVPMS
jgi:hypothetical protein